MSLYAPFLTSAEQHALRQVAWDDLTGEINIIRHYAARYLASASDGQVDSVRLSTLSLAFGQLAALVSAQMKEHLPLTSIEADRQAGLQLARLGLGLLSWSPSAPPSPSAPALLGPPSDPGDSHA